MGTYSTHCAALMNRLITLKVYDVYVLIYGKRASLYFLPRFTSQLFRQSEPSNYACNLWFLKGKWQTRRRHDFQELQKNGLKVTFVLKHSNTLVIFSTTLQTRWNDFSLFAVDFYQRNLPCFFRLKANSKHQVSLSPLGSPNGQ